jgi:hypothetical protein
VKDRLIEFEDPNFNNRTVDVVSTNLTVEIAR